MEEEEERRRGSNEGGGRGGGSIPEISDARQAVGSNRQQQALHLQQGRLTNASPKPAALNKFLLFLF